MFVIKRSDKNPILTPDENNPFEKKAVFNGCPVNFKNQTLLLYRAMSEPDPYKPPHVATSIIAIATMDKNGNYKDHKPFIVPSTDFDKFGCEDPRVTKIDDKYYIFYTALSDYPYGPNSIKTAVAITKDFKTIDSKHLVTPFNSKAMALFDRKINDKFVAFITIDTDPGPSKLCIRYFEKLEEIWDTKKWQKWYEKKDKYEIKLRRQEKDHVELGSAPLYTKKGWLVVYSHIQNYWTNDPIFGVEALILDLKNPEKIIGRTSSPFLVPEKYYEKIGQTPNIVFPSGVLQKKDILEIYYGAADNYCAKATVLLDKFVSGILNENKLNRFKNNPILKPREGLDFEAGGVLNPAVIEINGTIHILYRAVASSGVSTIGYATTKDGSKILERLDTPIYSPRVDFESRGCEDPRLTIIKDKIYMLYTGFNGQTPRVFSTSISVKDFLDKKWDKWAEPNCLTMENIPDKDAILLPEKFKDGYLLIHRAGDGICGDYMPTLDLENYKINKCINIAEPRFGMWDSLRIGAGAPPIKTKLGWVLIYHGISEDHIYRVGLMLLDLKDPTKVISRTTLPFFEPETEYEKSGVISNVVFPCGVVERNGLIYIYYGCADKYTSLATIKLNDMLDFVKNPD